MMAKTGPLRRLMGGHQMADLLDLEVHLHSKSNDDLETPRGVLCLFISNDEYPSCLLISSVLSEALVVTISAG